MTCISILCQQGKHVGLQYRAQHLHTACLMLLAMNGLSLDVTLELDSATHCSHATGGDQSAGSRHMSMPHFLAPMWLACNAKQRITRQPFAHAVCRVSGAGVVLTGVWRCRSDRGCWGHGRTGRRPPKRSNSGERPPHICGGHPHSCLGDHGQEPLHPVGPGALPVTMWNAQ